MTYPHIHKWKYNLWARKRGVMYPYAVILVTLFAMAFFWFVYYIVVTSVRGAILPSMEALEDNSTSTAWTLADSFVNNLFTYFLMLMVIGLLLWAIVYSQRKGVEVPYY